MACDQVPSTRQGASGFPDVLCRRLHVLQQLRGFIQHHLSQQTNASRSRRTLVPSNETCLVLPQHHLLTTRCSNEVCWSPPWPTSSSHCWSLRIRWISPPGRCWSASRLDLSSCTLDAKNWREESNVAWEVILNLYENFIFFTEIAMEE